VCVTQDPRPPPFPRPPPPVTSPAHFAFAAWNVFSHAVLPCQIHRILTSIHSLPYDPSAEREREELTDAIEARAQEQASRAALRADAAHYDTGGALRAGPTSLSEVEGHFFPAPAYQGEREGFVFKSGLLGLGYYPDGVSNGVSGSVPSRLPQPVRHAAGAHGGARASVDDVPSGAAGRRVRFAE